MENMHTDVKEQGVNFCPKSPHSQNLIQSVLKYKWIDLKSWCIKLPYIDITHTHTHKKKFIVFIVSMWKLRQQ